MAFTANTAFEPRIVNNEFNALCNVTGKYQASEADADCSAGLLVKRTTQLPCEGFAGVYNENAWYMVAAESTDTMDEVIYACNTYDAKKLNGYYIGTETLGLGVAAGEYGNFTRIDFDGQSVYRFGVGNLTAALGANTYFTIADGFLTPAASAPTDAGSIYFELRETGNFTTGTSDAFGYVDVVAKKVSVAA